MSQNPDRPNPEIVNNLQESPFDDSSKKLIGINIGVVINFTDGSTLTEEQISMPNESSDSELLDYQEELRKKYAAEAKAYRQELDELSGLVELDKVPVLIKRHDEDRDSTLTPEVLSQMQDAILGIEMDEIQDEVIDDDFVQAFAVQAMKRKRKKSE